MSTKRMLWKKIDNCVIAGRGGEGRFCRIGTRPAASFSRLRSEQEAEAIQRNASSVSKMSDRAELFDIHDSQNWDRCEVQGTPLNLTTLRLVKVDFQILARPGIKQAVVDTKRTRVFSVGDRKYLRCCSMCSSSVYQCR